MQAGSLFQHRQVRFRAEVPFNCTPLLKRASQVNVSPAVPSVVRRLVPSGSLGEVDVALLAEPVGSDGRSAVVTCLVR